MLKFILLVTLAISSLPSTGAQTVPSRTTDAESAKERRLRWFRDAKFGLFIHWGLYAIPAGEWKGKPVPGIGEWIMNRVPIPVLEYEKLTAQFNPIKFDADAWVRLAKDAGMRYIVITSKHHDGFALFQSKVSKFTSPFLAGRALASICHASKTKLERPIC